MRCLAVLVCVATTVARAQEPTPPPPPPSAPDSVRAESALVPPPPPSPEQKRFLDGLRTATRGIAQLKDGLNRVTRTQSKSDSVSQRSEEHTSELQSQSNLVCRLLLETKN